MVQVSRNTKNLVKWLVGVVVFNALRDGGESYSNMIDWNNLLARYNLRFPPHCYIHNILLYNLLPLRNVMVWMASAWHSLFISILHTLVTSVLITPGEFLMKSHPNTLLNLYLLKHPWRAGWALGVLLIWFYLLFIHLHIPAFTSLDCLTWKDPHATEKTKFPQGPG